MLATTAYLSRADAVLAPLVDIEPPIRISSFPKDWARLTVTAIT